MQTHSNLNNMIGQPYTTALSGLCCPPPRVRMQLYQLKKWHLSILCAFPARMYPCHDDSAIFQSWLGQSWYTILPIIMKMTISEYTRYDWAA